MLLVLLWKLLLPTGLTDKKLCTPNPRSRIEMELADIVSSGQYAPDGSWMLHGVSSRLVSLHHALLSAIRNCHGRKLELQHWIWVHWISQKWGLALHFQWHFLNSTFNSLSFCPLCLFPGCTFQEETFSIRCPKHKVSRWIGFTRSKGHLWSKRQPHYTMNFSVLVTFYHLPNNNEDKTRQQSTVPHQHHLSGQQMSPEHISPLSVCYWLGSSPLTGKVSEGMLIRHSRLSQSSYPPFRSHKL